MIVALYLAAIVAANLAVAHFGQVALLVTASLLIPFDLVVRDVLHERWQGNRLAVRMAALIAAGCALTALLNADAARVAIASSVAFTLASVGDALVFHLARARSRFVRMNASNVCGALVDSFLFPVIAFASVSAELSLTQAALKVVGGLAWSLVFLFFRRRSAC